MPAQACLCMDTNDNVTSFNKTGNGYSRNEDINDVTSYQGMGSFREVKVCLLGDSGVGKSSIVQRFVTDTYHDTISPTIGASFMGKTLQVGDLSCKFQIWDTAGQEKYRGLAPMYYRNAGAAVIVYDITNQNSFDLVRLWVRELQSHGPGNICIAICGNKCDLDDLREVSKEAGLAYAEEIGAIFAETSAKTAANIDQIFVEISKNLPPPESPSNQRVLLDSQSQQGKKGCSCSSGGKKG